MNINELDLAIEFLSDLKKRYNMPAVIAYATNVLTTADRIKYEIIVEYFNVG